MQFVPKSDCRLFTEPVGNTTIFLFFVGFFNPLRRCLAVPQRFKAMKFLFTGGLCAIPAITGDPATPRAWTPPSSAPPNRSGFYFSSFFRPKFRSLLREELGGKAGRVEEFKAWVSQRYNSSSARGWRGASVPTVPHSCCPALFPGLPRKEHPSSSSLLGTHTLFQ